MTDVTVLLNAIENGTATAEDLLPIVYDELRRLASGQMKHERTGHTLQATALVHEAFLKLVANEDATWENRRHFFGAAARAMQQILVDQARRKLRLKRGAELNAVAFHEAEIAADSLPDEGELLEISAALEAFAEEDPEKAELVRLKYFVGLTEPEIAAALGISRATASRWWSYSKAWLFARVNGAS